MIPFFCLQGFWTFGGWSRTPSVFVFLVTSNSSGFSDVEDFTGSGLEVVVSVKSTVITRHSHKYKNCRILKHTFDIWLCAFGSGCFWSSDFHQFNSSSVRRFWGWRRFQGSCHRFCSSSWSWFWCSFFCVILLWNEIQSLGSVERNLIRIWIYW